MSQVVVNIAALKAETRGGSVEVELHVQLSSVAQRATREGKPFLHILAADASDSFALRVWSDHAQYDEICKLAPGAFVSITGEFSQNAGFGLEARRWKCRPLSDDERAALLAGGESIRVLQDGCYRRVEEYVASFTDPRIAAVARLFLAEYGPRFRRSAAARTFHHARRGGLVEHVSRMMESASAICGVYTDVNRDLLLAGALFHDSGKLWENHVPESGFGMPYDERGELLGHITIGIELLNSLWRKAAQEAGDTWDNLNPPSESVRLHLLHLVAAHHGEIEFGSPVVPKTPEAIALHYIDNLDAKLEMFAAGYRTGARIADRIIERVKPLPGNLVEPLPPFAEQV